MLKINLSKHAARFLKKLPPKHGWQIAERLQLLRENPESIPSVELRGYSPFRRAKSGEYRIIFYVENDVLYVPIIGKRNDDEVYQLLKRTLK